MTKDDRAMALHDLSILIGISHSLLSKPVRYNGCHRAEANGEDRESSTRLQEVDGVDDGCRTRDLRIHNPAL